MKADNKANRKPERPDTSQSRINNGTIGDDGGYEKNPKGSFHKLTERLTEKHVNEWGIHENEEDHSLGHKSAHEGDYARNEIDPNRKDETNTSGEKIKYPKKGYNYVENAGGTSAEDLDKNNGI